MKQKITPHLWYDKEAKEAAEFYTSVFPNSKIKNSTIIPDTPSGDCDILTIEIFNQEFTLISAGPYFKLNPSISFLVLLDTKEEVDELWEKLSEEGKPLMELGEYPFSEKYGWIQDKYGLSWQLMKCLGGQEVKQRIIPLLMFTQKQAGKAEEAINFYKSIFKNSKIGDIMRYDQDKSPDKEGTIAYAQFTLENQDFAAIDSAQDHKFIFNEAVSLMVHCDTQEEIDYYWKKLSAVPESEQCGWLKDKYGVSWQIVPTKLDKMMQDKDKNKIAKVTQAFLKMKKFDIKELKKAYEGK